MRATLSWCAAALLGLTPAVQAQDACAENFKWPSVGTWAEYQGTYDKKTPVSTRYAVVGSESRKDVSYKWIELKTHDAKQKKDMIYQMLVPDAGPLQMDGVEEIVMKVGTDPAMKMGSMMLGMMRGALAKSSAFKDACTGVTLVGTEAITVPAGSFTAKHYHSDKYETDTWVDARIPFSMVRSVGKSHEIVLAGTGTGATSSITETPQEMPGMPQAK